MVELPIEYMNKLANQLMFVSALLGGFSFTTLVTLLDKKSSDRIINIIYLLATIATSSFLISVIAMLDIIMKTTEGLPLIANSDFSFARIVGVFAFLIGIISFTLIISLIGWTKSKRLGLFSTIIGIVSIIFVLMLMSSS